MISQLPESMPPEGLESQEVVSELRSAWLYEHVKNVLFEEQANSVRGTEVVDVCKVKKSKGMICVTDGRHRAWIRIVDTLSFGLRMNLSEQVSTVRVYPTTGSRIKIDDISVDFDDDECFFYWARYQNEISTESHASTEDMMQLPEINQDGGLRGFAFTVGCSPEDDIFTIKDRLISHQKRALFKDDDAFCRHRDMLTSGLTKKIGEQYQDDCELELPEEEATQSQAPHESIPPSPGLDLEMQPEAARFTKTRLSPALEIVEDELDPVRSTTVDDYQHKKMQEAHLLPVDDNVKQAAEEKPGCAADEPSHSYQNLDKEAKHHFEEDNRASPAKPKVSFQTQQSQAAQSDNSLPQENERRKRRNAFSADGASREKRLSAAQMSAKKRRSLVLETDVAGMVAEWWDEVYARNPRRRPRFPPRLPNGTSLTDLANAFDHEYELRNYLRGLSRSEFHDISSIYRDNPSETAASCFELGLIRLILTLRMKRRKNRPYESKIKNILLKLEGHHHNEEASSS